MDVVATNPDETRVSVVVPTWKRPHDLARCLAALATQRRPADEVLVVIRSSDNATRAALADLFESMPGISIVAIEEAGVVAALNAGLSAATGDIIAFTDDDAAPRPDWVERISAHFRGDPKLGAVGGRDCIRGLRAQPVSMPVVVGKLQWFGRVIGNHHLGTGEPRPVDVLKGVNMAFRREVLLPEGSDRRLRGQGAQVHWELALSLRARRAGYALLYDPAVLVDHYPAERFDRDQRNQLIPAAITDQVHNETLAILEHLPTARRLAFLTWATLSGTRDSPGLLLGLVGAADRRRILPTLRGRLAGLRTFRAGNTASS
jgi:GT2 family glycosyltransferase